MEVAWAQELQVIENRHPVEPQPLSEGLLELCLADRTVPVPGRAEQELVPAWATD